MNSKASSLSEKATAGVIWTTIFSLLGRAAILLAQLLLAKFLVPEDFGVLGLAYTITTFFDIIANFGIERVYLQRHKRMHLWGTQVFCLSLGLALLAAILLSLAAPFGALMYNNEKVTPIIWIIASAMPFTAMSIVPLAKLKAELRFKFIALYTSFELIVTQTSMVILAYCGCGAYSFVIPLPFVAVMRLIVYWRVSPVPLRALKYARGWLAIFRRGASVFSITVLTTTIGQGAYVILGSLSSAHVVGLYYFSFRLVAQPMLLFATNFTNVLRPALINMHGDLERQRRAALKTAEMLGLITIPICTLQAILAGPGLELLFGERWAEAIILIQVLSIGLPFDALSWAAGCFLDARGKYSRSLRYQLTTAPIFFISVFVGAKTGSALGAVIGVSFYYIVHSCYMSCRVFLPEGIKFADILSCYYVPAVMSLLSFGLAYYVSCVVDGLIWKMILMTSVGSGAYLFLLLRFRYSTAMDILSRLRKKRAD